MDPLGVVGFFRKLAEAFDRKPAEPYTALDRYRDFRRVFLEGNATAQQGKRVLWEIMKETGWDAQCPPSWDEDNVTMPRFEGRRDIGCFLMRMLYVEPVPQPEQAIKESPRGRAQY